MVFGADYNKQLTTNNIQIHKDILLNFVIY